MPCHRGTCSHLHGRRSRHQAWGRQRCLLGARRRLRCPNRHHYRHRRCRHRRRQCRRPDCRRRCNRRGYLRLGHRRLHKPSLHSSTGHLLRDGRAAILRTPECSSTHSMVGTISTSRGTLATAKHITGVRAIWRGWEGVPECVCPSALVCLKCFSSPSLCSHVKKKGIRDRISSSIIFKGHKWVYGAAAGIVLSPKHNTILCSYDQDGGSDMRACSPEGVSARCLPGCNHKGVNGAFGWCHPGWGLPNCAWKASDLQSMLEISAMPGKGYNEVRTKALWLWQMRHPPTDPALSRTGLMRCCGSPLSHCTLHAREHCCVSRLCSGAGGRRDFHKQPAAQHHWLLLLATALDNQWGG